MTEQTIVLERTYPVSAEALWDLWTTKDGFESWWGPQGFRVEVHALEPRNGGTLHYDMIASAPEAIEAMKKMGQPVSHETRSTFSEVTPRRRIAMTHVIDFVKDVKPYTSTSVVEFIPSGTSTRMVIHLTPMHDEQWTQMATMGWNSQLSKLDARFARA